eukprot:1160308-Pelagomonas_calceolata.AAC.7
MGLRQRFSGTASKQNAVLPQDKEKLAALRKDLTAPNPGAIFGHTSQTARMFSMTMPAYLFLWRSGSREWGVEHGATLHTHSTTHTPQHTHAQPGWMEEQWAKLAPTLQERLGLTRTMAPSEVEDIWQLCQFEAGVMSGVNKNAECTRRQANGVA